MDKECSNSLHSEPELEGTKILVFSNSDASHIPVVDVTRAENLVYCKKHGYAWKSIWCTSNVRAIGWAKVAATHHLFRLDFQWLVYLDSDVMFTNKNVSLESIIECARESSGKDAEIIFSADMGGRLFNAGFIMIRRSEKTKLLLERWWDTGTTYGLRNTLFYEQGTLTRMTAEDPAVNARVSALPQRCSPHFFNHGFFVPDSMQWKPSDFAVHIAGAKSVTTKLSLLKEVQALDEDFHFKEKSQS